MKNDFLYLTEKAILIARMRVDWNDRKKRNAIGKKIFVKIEDKFVRDVSGQRRNMKLS